MGVNLSRILNPVDQTGELARKPVPVLSEGPIDPRTLEHEYDPKQGNLGRGARAIVPAQVDLTGYVPYVVPGREPSETDIPIINTAMEETGWIWNGWVREENGKHFVVGFERHSA